MQTLALGFQFRSARYYLFTKGEIQQYELCIKGKKRCFQLHIYKTQHYKEKRGKMRKNSVTLSIK